MYLVEYNMQELSSENENFTPSDVERALWSSAMETKQLASHPDADSKFKPSKSSKRKRNPWFSNAQVDINACNLFILTLFSISYLCPHSLQKALTVIPHILLLEVIIIFFFILKIIDGP